MNRFWLFPALLILSSCSTVLDHSTQEVMFETPGAVNSMCKIDTGDVSYKVHPPEEIIMMKTDDRLEVRCFADGHRQKTVMIEPVLSNNTFLNVSNGFVPGFALDEHTNAHYLYPDVIKIDFTNIPFEKAEQPAYAVNPSAPPIEHLAPKKGVLPAISNEDLQAPEPLKERQSKAYYTNTPETIYGKELYKEPEK